MRTALKWTVGLVLALLVALALFITFGLNSLRGPITRAVTHATGRELVIDGGFKVKWSWVHPRFRAEKVRFDNADWAREDYLLSADVVEASIRLLPLLRGRVIVPEVHLEGADLNLEEDAEGRKNWILKQDDQQKESRVRIELLTVKHGHLSYADAGRDIDLEADFHTDASGLVFATSGTYQGLDVSASGHTGHVLSLRDDSAPFPLKAEAAIGDTKVRVDGVITGLVGLKGFDTRITLSGQTMDELYWVVNVALPSTKPYTTTGRLVRDGTVVRYANFTGKVGESDIAGTLEVDTGGKRPFMKGALTTKTLNFADLGALVGTDQPRQGGLLPDMPFEPERWDSVDADVRIKAGTISRPKQLPIENLSARIQMKDSVLTLNPLEFGIAGGKLAGPVKLDGSKDTIRAETQMRVRNLQLAKLFPTIKENQASVGDLSGLVELNGSGNSVARMLGSASGKIGFFMDGGKISQFMMELAALDLWHATRVKLQGDQPIEIRCAVADFAVKDGVMNTNAFVFDTAVVVVEGGGAINLNTEEMDLKLHPKPRDSSLASLNSPLYVRGTFSEPKVAPEWGKLAVKGVGAVVLGVINPLLAVLPLVKEGKGEDSNCAQLIAQAVEAKKAKETAATSSGRSASSGATAKRPPSQPAR
jgi:AsmA protein